MKCMKFRCESDEEREEIVLELNRLNKNLQHDLKKGRFLFACNTWITYSDNEDVFNATRSYDETTLEQLKLM